jgi:hypothetical protein
VPSCEWVLDTWLLCIALDYKNPEAITAISFLEEIRSHHCIAVDHDGKIFHEYWRHAPANSHVGQWLRQIVNRSDKIHYFDGKLGATHKHKLLNNLGFDYSDLVFVGVSANSQTKVIVSGDSDYSQPVRDYLMQKLGVTVLSLQEALARARIL